MAVFAEMCFTFMFAFAFHLLDQVTGVQWSGTKFSMKFSLFRLVKELGPKKTRCAEGFAVGVELLEVTAKRTRSVVDTKEGLKTWPVPGLCRYWIFTDTPQPAKDLAAP